MHYNMRNEPLSYLNIAGPSYTNKLPVALNKNLGLSILNYATDHL